MSKDNKPEEKFVLEYTLPYRHIVRVGITAKSREGSVRRAEAMFKKATLWDDTEKVPLLYDDFEEQDSGDILEFRIVQELPEDASWPEPGVCVKRLRREKAAVRAAELLVQAYRKGEKNGGSIQWEDLDLAYEAALKAV